MTTNIARRSFQDAIIRTTALFGASTLFAQTPVPNATAKKGAGDRADISNHVHNGIYYFPGIGSNSGYPKEDHVVVTDPFDRHVTRTMDAVKKSLARAGCTMDSILHLEVYICLPHSDNIPMPTGKARFDAHTAQYQILNKIYGTYFSAGKAPARACMAVDWIPGDSLIEVVGSAVVVNSPA